MADVTLPRKRVQGETVEERLPDPVVEEILPARHLRHEDGEVVETPTEMFERVAEAVAAPEAEYGNDPAVWADRFERLMTDLEFMPNSPTLMNAGTRRDQLAACFVINPDDDFSDIFETVKEAAEIFSSGGGVGYSFSKLRPKGDLISETSGTAGGPVSFMSVFDGMCETVKQGGVRRGAQMGMLRVDHPDIGRFCVAKRTEGTLTNFNLSVPITDDFLDAVDADERYDLYNPQTGETHVVTEETAEFYSAEYAEAAPDDEENLWRDYAEGIEGIDQYRGELGVDVDEPMDLPARFVWRLIVDSAWRNGEPGVFYIDEANRDHAFDVDERPEHRIRATNPCGEQPLEQYEACNLGHVNLSLIVSEGAPYWPGFRPDADLEERVEAFLEESIDFERLDRITRWGTRLLEDVICASGYPIEEIDDTVRSMRKIGLGVMGFAELLVQLGVEYGSDASVEVARQLMAHIDRTAIEMSHELAGERGSFERWPESRYADPTAYPEWFRDHTGRDPAEWADGYRVRNHGVTSIAPTGTTSMIGDTSAGCEPLYGVVYVEHVSEDVGETIVAFDDYFERVLEANGIEADEVRSIAEQQVASGEFEGLDSLPVPEELAAPFVTAHEVTPEAHVRIQAAFQEGVDGAVSKTINLPRGATHENVAETFHLAADLDCKGLTVYRAGSREEQALEVDHTTDEGSGTAGGSGSDEGSGSNEGTDTTNSADATTDDPDPRDDLYGGLST